MKRGFIVLSRLIAAALAYAQENAAACAKAGLSEAEVEVRQAIGDKKWVVPRKLARTLKNLTPEEKKGLLL